MNLPKTMHAPAERLSELDIRRQYSYFENEDLVKQTLDSVNIIAIVTNDQRQIVFANKETLNLLTLDSITPILGKRPGEIFECIHASDNPGGCGTSEACRNCGAVNTILKVISSKQPEKGELCLTTHDHHESFNLLVSGTPYKLKEENFYVLTFMDISDSQRKRALERIFFHDIINITSGLSGLVTLLKDDVPESLKEDIDFIDRSFKGLVEEIVAQRQLLEAENNNLIVENTTVQAKDLLETLKRIYEVHKVAQNRKIVLLPHAENISFKSDYALIKRVLGNMLKNALEETKVGETVTLGYSLVEEEGKQYIKLWVHNKEFMDKHIQLQIFQRFFSTKGNGRGLGTYSMKLLGERYLRGKVDFVSQEESGTTFAISLPL